MKTIFAHMFPYRDIPDDFAKENDSIWITPSNDRWCDSEAVHGYLNESIDELEYAIDLGFDGVGVNEHHQNAYDLSSAPAMAAYILARKKSDAAICVLGSTIPTHPPLRIAEEYALIDCMSNGRLIAGFPVGTAMDTVGCAGINPTEVRPRFYEGMDLIQDAWKRPGPFSFNGKYNQLRYVNPWPKPIQEQPPVWLGGGGSLETYSYAVENDYCYNLLSLTGIASAKAGLETYWNVVEEAGRPFNPYRAGMTQVVAVADTDEEARRLYEPHILNFFKNFGFVPPNFAAVPGYMTTTSLRALLGRTGGADPFKIKEQPTFDYLLETDSIIVGSPETVADKLIELATSLKIGHLTALMQLHSMPSELTKYSMELYAEKVMPRVRHIWDGQGYDDHWWPKNAQKPAIESVDDDRKVKVG